MNRQQRIQWFIDSLGLKKINGNKGTMNCGRCAFRMDTYIAQGETRGRVTPVPKKSANLYSFGTYEDNQIRRLFVDDFRVLARVNFPELNSESLVVYDITDEEGDPVLDLTFEVNQERKKSRVKLTKAQNDLSLAAQLRNCPRRAKDGTAYGFIWLTNTNLNLGHVINYFVDSSYNNDEVYFIDAQLGEVVDDSYFNRFRSDVFYLPSYPPEGYRIKSEHEEHIQIKKENIQTMKTENELFIDQVIDTVKQRDENALKNLSGQRAFICARNSKRLNAMNLLAYSNSETSMDECLWFAQHGGTIHCAAAGAAFGGHVSLMNAFIEKISALGPTSPVNYNQLASAAARGGQKDLMNLLIKKMEDSMPPIPVDYNLLAMSAAESGHDSLMNSLRTKMKMPTEPLVNLKALIAATALGGQESLMNTLINQNSESFRGIRVDYNFLASRAALGGHEALVTKLIKQMSEHTSSVRVDLNKIASAAGQGGHLSMMNGLINQMIGAGVVVNYNSIAGSVAACGIFPEMYRLIIQMKSSNPPLPVYYNEIASFAAHGGQIHIVRWLVDQMREAKPAIAIEHELILNYAKRGGYNYLVDKLKKFLLPEPVANTNQKRQSDAVPDIVTQPGKKQQTTRPSARPRLFTQNPESPLTNELEQLKKELARANSLIKIHESQQQYQRQQIAGKELEINELKQQVDGLKKQNEALEAQLDEAQKNIQIITPGNGF